VTIRAGGGRSRREWVRGHGLARRDGDRAEEEGGVGEVSGSEQKIKNLLGAISPGPSGRIILFLCVTSLCTIPTVDSVWHLRRNYFGFRHATMASERRRPLTQHIAVTLTPWAMWRCAGSEASVHHSLSNLTLMVPYFWVRFLT